MKLLSITIAAVLAGYAPVSAQTPPSGPSVGVVAPDADYLGEEQPGAEPRIFAPGTVSLGGVERDVAISPDGREVIFGACASRCTLFVTRRGPRGWSEPEEAPFAGDPRFNVLEPAFTQDGKRVLFLSDRAPAGQAAGPVTAWEHQNIWASERTESGWAEAVLLGPAVNGAHASFYPSVARDGTLYFTRQDKNSEGTSVFRSASRGGAFEPAKRVAAAFNDSWSPYNACISPDGSVLVFCSSQHAAAEAAPQFWASFRNDDDSWSEPVNLGTQINAPETAAQSCSFSPDGRYFFFSSVRRVAIAALPARLTLSDFRSLHERPGNGSSDIYWVEASVVQRLRPAEPLQPAGRKD